MSSINLLFLGNAGDLEDNTGGDVSDSSESSECRIDQLAATLDCTRVSSAGHANFNYETKAQEISLKPLISPKSMWKTDLECCLERYTAEELLSGSNQVFCDNCTMKKNGSKSNGHVRRDMIKRDLIIRLPAILTIHLKRFQQVSRVNCIKKRANLARTFRFSEILYVDGPKRSCGTDLPIVPFTNSLSTNISRLFSIVNLSILIVR